MSLPMFRKMRLRPRGRGHLASDHGVALVEFALVLPFLLLVAFGMLDLGRAVSYWNDQTHLANQAARYAAVNACADCVGSSINQYVLGQAESQQLRDNATLNIAFSDANGKFPGDAGYTPPAPGIKNHCVGQSLKVTVKYAWSPMPTVTNLVKAVTFGGVTINPVNITASSTQRLERAWNGDAGTGLGSGTAVPPDKYNVDPGTASADTC